MLVERQVLVQTPKGHNFCFGRSRFVDFGKTSLNLLHVSNYSGTEIIGGNRSQTLPQHVTVRTDALQYTDMVRIQQKKGLPVTYHDSPLGVPALASLHCSEQHPGTWDHPQRFPQSDQENRETSG